MIQFQGVSYTYPGDPGPTLHEIDLTVRRGEWVLLAGPSGCGKSTLLHLVSGVIPQVLGGDLRGDVRVDGLAPSRHSIRDISRRIGTVFQSPELQLFMLRIEDDVAFGCENLGYSPDETRSRVDAALARLSLGSIRRQEVFTLSGGQKQRLAIAGALAMGAEVLLLDEPTSDLDEDGRAELLDALRDLHRQGHTILMTEHRFDGLESAVDRVIAMNEGKIVPSGSFSTHDSIAPRESVSRRGDQVLIDADRIEFAYPGREPVLRQASFRLRAGEIVALTGANGTGKTTLLKLLCGLLRPGSGRLQVAGMERPSLRDLVGTVGFLFQNPDEQLFTDCVADEILFGARNLRRSVDLSYFLDRTGLTRYRKAHPRTLSRGERQRLAAASVSAMQPRVVLLDEPTTGLDRPAWTALMDLLVEEAARVKACILFSTHHREAARAFAGRTLTIRQGRLIDDCLS